MKILKLQFGSLFLLLSSLASAGPVPSPRARFEASRSAAREEITRLDPRGKTSVSWSAHRSKPNAILGLRVRTAGATPQERARGFISAHRALFVDSDSVLKLRDLQRTRNRQVVRFTQLYRGLEVMGGGVTVQLDPQGNVRGVRASTTTPRLPGSSLSPRLTPLSAIRAALDQLGRRGAAPPRGARARLAILTEGASRLVYRVILPLALDPRGRVHLVDARSGQALGWRRGAITERSPRLSRGGAR